MMPEIAEIKRGALEIISETELLSKLKKGPLRVKFGADPTSADIHLGHTVVLEKLRKFQELGHSVVFIIGDYTAMIGDPSGRSETRNRLSKEEVKRNSVTYQEQVFKILDRNKTEVVYNSRWFDSMSSMELLELTTHSTVAQMLARADFKKRYTEGSDISMLEFMYPLLQAYDSIKVKADVEIGGSDQKFNLLMGRQFQLDFKQEPQVVITMPLLEGLDGVKKMSKTYGNYIGICEPPNEIFGKVMSISDELMIRYYELLTYEDIDSVKEMNPRDAKAGLAGKIVERFYDAGVAENARNEFERVFVKKDVPAGIGTLRVKEKKACVVDLLVQSGLVPSKNEARRAIRQGAFRVDDIKITDEKLQLEMEKEYVFRIGRRKFIRVKGT